MNSSSFKILGNIKSKNVHMVDIISAVEHVGSLGLNVLIVGDRGTGRDSLAQAIHSFSPKASVPMNIIRCASAMGRDLVLKRDAINYVDDVHRLRPGLQGKLMREMDAAPDAQIIASAYTCIGPMMDEKTFKFDLYTRLANVRMGVPRLTQRKEDIPSMVRDALRTANKMYGKKVKIESRAITPLKHYKFVGNITELYSIIERAVLSCRSGTIRVNSILSILDMYSLSLASLMMDSDLSYSSSMKRFERDLLINAVRDMDSVDKAASVLHISTDFLIDRFRALDISERDLTEDAG